LGLMALQPMPSGIPLMAAVALLMLAALYAWFGRRSSPGAGAATLLLLSGAVWIAGYALVQVSAGLSTKLFWLKAQYLGAVVVPIAWLVFASQHSGREERLTRRMLCLLSLVPLISLLLVFTNEIHGLIWAHIALGVGGQSLDKTYGVGFWICIVAYSYMLVLAGVLMLVRAIVRRPRLYGWPTVALVLAASVAWLGSALKFLGVDLFPWIDPGIVGLAVGGPIMVWALRRPAGEAMPAIREAAVEAMSDGVIVLDELDHIVDVNPAGERLIGGALEEMVGKRLGEVAPGWEDGIGGRAGREVMLDVGKARRACELRVSDLADGHGQPAGRVVVLHDITERKRVEEAVREGEEKYRYLAEQANDGIAIVQDTLLRYVNPRLAQLEGHSVEGMIGTPFPRYIHPEELPRIIERYKRRMAGEDVEPIYETALRSRDGGKIPVEISVSEIAYKERPAELVVIRELAERRGAEDAIRRHGEELSALLDTAQALSSSLELEQVLQTMAR